MLLVPGLGGRKTWFERRYGLLGTAFLVVAGLAALPVLRLLGDDVSALDSGLGLAVLTVLLIGLLGVVGVRSPRPYAGGLALVLVVPLLLSGGLATSRTFFGVQQVRNSEGVHVLTHGSTVHGTKTCDLARSANRAAATTGPARWGSCSPSRDSGWLAPSWDSSGSGAGRWRRTGNPARR